MYRLNLSSILIIIFSALFVSCQQWPQVRTNKQFKFIRDSNMYIIPAAIQHNDLYQDTIPTLTNIMKSKKIYTIADMERGTKPRLAKYTELYRDNALSPKEIGEIAALLHADSGYLVFSSLDTVNVHNYSREKTNDRTRVGNRHAHVDVATSTTTTYYTKITLIGRLSMYDIASGGEFLKINHRIIREKQDKVESQDCNPIGCLFNAIFEPIVNDSLRENTLEKFSYKVLTDYYTDMAGHLPK